MTATWQTIERALAERGRGSFLRSTGADLSGDDVLAEIQRATASDDGRGAHAVVPMLTDTSPRSVIALLTAWSRERVTFPLPPREPPERLNELRHTVRDAHLPGAATILCTSGSTAQPKLVVHALDQHLASAHAAAAALDLNPGDTWLLNLPLHHVGGLAPIFRAIVSGGSLAIPAEGEDVTEALQHHSPTHVSLVATQLRRCIDDDEASAALARAKCVLCGGGPFDRELLRRSIERGIPIAVSYGSTETASLITLEREPAFVLQPGCAGTPLPGRRVQVTDDGEILVAGSTLLWGYLEQGQLTDPRNADGWFATGDLGSLDSDGRLTVAGRRDRMFISGGENIHPEEIELALLSIDGVVEALVEPISHPEFERRPAAFVRLAPDKAMSAGDLARALAPRLARFKIPDRFGRLPGREPL